MISKAYGVNQHLGKSRRQKNEGDDALNVGAED